MDRRALPLLAAGLLALPLLAARADGDAGHGRELAYTCLGCHGIEQYKNAYPKYSVPKLGGQNQAYLVVALGQYQAGNRWHPTMQGYASTLTDAERADLAAFFASVPSANPVAEPVGAPPAKADACVACHGRSGEGTMDEYPNIGGQHADYLAQVLNDYRLGKRKSPLMQPFAQQLSREDIAALAAFFSKQPGLVTPSHD
jgi:cytochrome c553